MVKGLVCRRCGLGLESRHMRQLTGTEAGTLSSQLSYVTNVLDFRLNHCKHTAHSCVVACKERGGGLSYGDSLNSSGNDDNVFICLFVV